MKKIATVLSILIFAAGCGQKALPEFSPSEARAKLVRILKEENGLTVTTKEFDHALWIYLPFEEGFLELKAKKEPSAGPSAIPAVSPAVHFLDVKFKDGRFEIQYDISPLKTYPKDPGYTSGFSEKYQTDQRSILTAISRAYADFEELPGEDALVERVPGDVDFAGEAKNAAHKEMVHAYVKTAKAPSIFVIVMADITDGLEARVFLHLKDLKRAYTDQTFYEEYSRRVVSEQPFGDPAIVGDQTGRHVDFHDIALPEFLARQMIFRINFKYTQSAFPPTGTPKETILQAAAQTVGAYDFKEFTSVELRDLSDGAAYSVSKDQLAEYNSEKPSEGRLIRIRFQ